ncbi:hypothetical protein, partial [Alicyclobacillus contaminans]|uniref:hypothetical protein n=1 Tax=Alicyclobacillus contaminans TaxID=392016 RepID=UPI001B7FC8AF
VQAQFGKPSAPQSDGYTGSKTGFNHLLIGPSIRRSEHNLRSADQFLWSRRGTDPLFQLVTFIISECNFNRSFTHAMILPQW